MKSDIKTDIPEPTERGRILRLRQGYNPNSSSLGTVVFSFKAAMLALPVLFSTAGAILLARSEKKGGEQKESGTQQHSEEPASTDDRQVGA